MIEIIFFIAIATSIGIKFNPFVQSIGMLYYRLY